MDFDQILEEIRPIDLTPLIDRSASLSSVESTSKLLLESLYKYGVCIVKDPRVPFERNENFIDMMEDYFARSDEEKKDDIFPDLGHQIGATPSNTEKARNHCARVETLDPKHRPLTPCPPEADIKWRYLWRIGSKGKQNVREIINDLSNNNLTNKESAFAILNAPNAIPKNLENWEELCNEWGDGLLHTCETISEGIAMSLGLQREYFTKIMSNAPHLLAPTGTDLNKYGKEGTVMAGYHYDLNFLTIHGKSRYPGLLIWLRDGRKVRVKIPDGCLLVQAAKQLEWLTGGYIYAGFHEVVVIKDTIKAIEKQKLKKRPLWRISSTLFSHIRSDVILKVIEPLQSQCKNIKDYPPIPAGEQVANELKIIGLLKDHNNDKKKENEIDNNKQQRSFKIAIIGGALALAAYFLWKKIKINK